jgi:hypothetical protein
MVSLKPGASYLDLQVELLCQRLHALPATDVRTGEDGVDRLRAQLRGDLLCLLPADFGKRAFVLIAGPAVAADHVQVDENLYGKTLS